MITKKFEEYSIINRSTRSREVGYGLINAITRLDKMELKLLYTIAGMSESDTLIVRGTDLTREAGIHAQWHMSAKEYLYKTIEKLMKASIRLFKGNREYEAPDFIIKSAEYYTKSNTWVLRLGNWFKAIGDKTRGFVPVDCKVVREFRTKYAQPIFNWLHTAAKSGKFSVSFSTLREKLSLPDSYKRSNSLMARVVIPAVNAINSTGILNVDYSIVRKKNYCEKVVFEVFDKERLAKEADLQAKIQEANDMLNEQFGYNCSDNMVSYLAKRKIRLDKTMELANRFGVRFDNIITLLVLTELRHVTDPLAYVAGMLKNGVSGTGIVAKRKAINLDATRRTSFTINNELDCRYAITVAEVLASMTFDVEEEKYYRSLLSARYETLHSYTNPEGVTRHFYYA